MKILWDTIRFNLVGFIDRRGREQVIAERRMYDNNIEKRWRERVAANAKEQRRLSGTRRWERCAAPGLIREGQSALHRSLTTPAMLRRQA